MVVRQRSKSHLNDDWDEICETSQVFVQMIQANFSTVRLPGWLSPNKQHRANVIGWSTLKINIKSNIKVTYF